ncbi:MAG: hypothetical protein SFU98_10120 [Leptospiraceae bacterium]|nr:hypothetical protein [Leptospiraceae bacterium]
MFPKIVFAIFYILTFSLFAAEGKQPPSQMEALIWGVILFSIAMGSLLLIVYAFPKSEAYKKQVAAKMVAKAKPLTVKKPETKPKEEKDDDTTAAFPTIHTQQMPITKPNISTEPLTNISDVKVSDPEMPSFDQQEQEPPKVTPPPPQVPGGECRTVSFDHLYKSKNPEVDALCREHLLKLSSLLPSKSISVYFIKSGQFTRYLERKGETFLSYDPVTERSDITEDVAKFLRKKLGAFSSTHTDAVLPMVSGEEIFGAIKLQFLDARKNLDIGPVWSEIKSFAKQISASQSSKMGTGSKETNLYTMEHFNNILNYRTTLDVPQSLILFKVRASDKTSVFNHFAESLKEVLGKKPEVYKISDDTLGVFLNLENRLKLSGLFQTFILGLKKFSAIVDVNCGACDFHSSYKIPQKWLDKAKLSLSESEKSGANRFHLHEEK